MGPKIIKISAYAIPNSKPGGFRSPGGNIYASTKTGNSGKNAGTRPILKHQGFCTLFTIRK
jgi:hypothetical protein